MLHVIPNQIAQRHGIDLSGKRHSTYREGRSIKVIWYIDNGTFTFYTNGDWDINKHDGEYIEGHTNPPTQKIWVKRLEKKYWAEYATAAWYEWVALKSKRA